METARVPRVERRLVPLRFPRHGRSVQPRSGLVGDAVLAMSLQLDDSLGHHGWHRESWVRARGSHDADLLLEIAFQVHARRRNHQSNHPSIGILQGVTAGLQSTTADQTGQSPLCDITTGGWRRIACQRRQSLTDFRQLTAPIPGFDRRIRSIDSDRPRLSQAASRLGGQSFESLASQIQLAPATITIAQLPERLTILALSRFAIEQCERRFQSLGTHHRLPNQMSVEPSLDLPESLIKGRATRERRIGRRTSRRGT